MCVDSSVLSPGEATHLNLESCSGGDGPDSRWNLHQERELRVPDGRSLNVARVLKDGTPVPCTQERRDQVRASHKSERGSPLPLHLVEPCMRWHEEQREGR